MSETTKITPGHLDRCACVYVRQSSAAQVEHNRESTERQYQLVERAHSLGWASKQVQVVDNDLGISGAGTSDRPGFAHLTSEVGLGRVGIVLALEVSRLARNNAEWYRLLDLCGVTNTLIGDADGIYHPGLLNDRLVLGLKGTMSEAELHVLRARLNGGIRNKAARGELRRGLPVGLDWGEEDGSARQVWLWFRSQDMTFPLQSSTLDEIRWVAPTYTKIHQVLTNPVYAGAYVYGKTRHERFVDETGQVRKRVRKLPRSEWAVLLHDHHQGFIDWETFERNQARLAQNTRPRPHESGGAVREGAALLQGIASCGLCGRRLLVFYSGRNSSPGYYCAGSDIVQGRGSQCMRVGGVQIDRAVAGAVLEALTPAGLEASLKAAAQLEADHEAVLAHFRRDVERARYEVQRAERRYRAVDPEHRLVARGLEAEWEQSLAALEAAEQELVRRERQRLQPLTPAQRSSVLSLGQDLERLWSAPTTTDRDRKELLRTLLEEVLITVNREEERGTLTLRWRGGLIRQIDVPLPRSRPSPIRTEEETIELVRRLAIHYPDAVIAGILNRQGRRTAKGMRFTANRVSSLRNHRGIPCFQPPPQRPDGELLTVHQTAERLGVAASTVHRWLNDGFIAGEQPTPGAPWRIRFSEELRSRFVEETPEGYVSMSEAVRMLGVSRQTVLHHVKSGQLKAVHVRSGRRKGLRIKVLDMAPGLFDQPHSDRG